MLFLTNNDSQVFQSRQHVLFRVQHFLCRFLDISMRFFREHPEMFWRANVNLQLIPPVMDGSDRFTERKVLWVVRKRYELVARGAFLQRRSDKRKTAASPPLNYTPLWRSKNMAEDATWENTFIDARDIQRSHVTRLNHCFKLHRIVSYFKNVFIHVCSSTILCTWKISYYFSINWK